MSYAYYGLTFGIQNMSGDLYINMFLMNVIEIPANFVTMYIVNRYVCFYSYCFIYEGYFERLANKQKIEDQQRAYILHKLDTP